MIAKVAKIKICGEIINAKVAIALIEDVPYLLGREDIFDKFKILFRQKHKVIYLEPEG